MGCRWGFIRRPQDFDAVVSELGMPGMSGIELASQLLAIRPGIPTLLSSGYIRPEDEEAVRNLGLPPVLLKTGTAEKLGQMLHRILAKAESEETEKV